MLDPSELFPEIPNLYEFPSTHADMLFDRERTQRYKEAICQSIQPGDIVADIYKSVPKELHPAAAQSVYAHILKLVDEGSVSSAGAPRLDGEYSAV